MTIQVTSKNRGEAKKLLTFCGLDSRRVRNMTLQQLSTSLQRCVSEGLITVAQIKRAFGAKSQWENDQENDGPSNVPEELHDEEYEKANSNDGPDESDQTDVSTDVDGQSTDASESDAKDSDADGDGEESDSPDADSENSDADGDGEESDSPDADSENSDSDDASDETDDDTPLQHEVLPRVLKYIKAGLNVALVGPAGTGKSYIARQVAGLTERDFYVNGAMMSKYDLIGYNDAHGTYHETPAYQAFKEGGLHCFDELDGSAPDAVVAFNGMTDDQPFYTFPCGQVEQHEDYVAIACMNTWGNGASADYVGRFKQDAASMSRFVKVFVGYDDKIEARIAGPHKDILTRVRALRAACEELGMRHIVSTRMIVQARKAREAGKATKAEIDTDILFAGLDDAAIKQLKTAINAALRKAKGGK